MEQVTQDGNPDIGQITSGSVMLRIIRINQYL